MVTTADDVYFALREYVDDVEEPVAQAVDLADRVEVSRRTVLSRLEELEARGDVGSRKVGRARIWWPADLFPPADPPAEPTSTDEPPADPSADPPAEPTTSPDLPPADPPAEPTSTDEPPADPSADPPAEADDVLEAIVDDVARNWNHHLDNYERRREAALAALQWLREDGGPARAADVKAALLDRYGVEEESPDAWWRTTVRPGLQEAVDRDLAEYRHGRHEYHWTG